MRPLTEGNAPPKPIVDRDIAADIKKQLDARFGRMWHVVVGADFGSFVSHESGAFAYIYLKDRAVLMFRTPS